MATQFPEAMDRQLIPANTVVRIENRVVTATSCIPRLLHIRLLALNVVALAVLALWILAIYGAFSLLATNFSPRFARVSSRSARAASRALPPEAGAATGYGYGFSPPFSRRALIVYSVAGSVFFPIWLTFTMRHLPTEVVRTTEDLWVVRRRHPRLGVGRRVVVAHGSSVDAWVVENRWKGAAVVEVANNRIWLCPGHSDAVLLGYNDPSCAV